MADDDRLSYGTAARDAPASRADLERAVRGLVLSDLDTRDALLQLAAQVVALVDELTRRLDGVEPRPAVPGTPAAPPHETVEAAVEAAVPAALARIRAVDAHGPDRVWLDGGESKYAVTPAEVPCAELLPICQARCCRLRFALSTADLDEGLLRWDYAKPYVIRQRASDGYCVHNDPDGRGCTVHAVRPRPCRVFDCRGDARIWIDFERRIPAPEAALLRRNTDEADGGGFDLLERARARAVALRLERHAVNEGFADPGPVRGPK